MRRFGQRRGGIPPYMKSRSNAKQFKALKATELYCPKCKQSMPVIERLLLVLPEGDKYEYLCANCGESVGDRIEKGPPQSILLT